ncbi:MAG: hypothetical protein AAB214_16095 [Fibrobacterota bacterium]
MVNLLVLVGALCAQNPNASLEDSLFAADIAVSTDSVKSMPALASAPSAPVAETKGVGISGQMQASSRTRVVRGDLPSDLTKFVGMLGGQEFEIGGRLDLDAPFPDGARAHVTMEFDHRASLDTTTFALREAFLDANIANTIRLRAGKQVLQWSRCQLWTPADLVNVEAPQFQQRLGAREGATGLRAHLPIGAQTNIYGFADLRGVRTYSDIALVGRVEFTLPHTEVGLTARHKDGERVVPAVDFSTGYDRWQVAGEAAWLQAGTLFDIQRMGDAGWIVPVDRRTPQVSISVSRPMDALGRTDRLRLGVEGFWNPEGESENVFLPLSSIQYARPLVMGRDSIRSGPEAALRVYGGAYRPYQLGQWYAMGYAILSDAPLTSSSLKASVLGNISDNSWLGLVEWSWESLHGLGATVSVSAPFGAYPAEFTWTSEWATLRADLGLRF